MIEVIGFDADDTLWHSEDAFVVTQERFTELVRPYIDPECSPDLDAALLERESANLHLFGYGAKGFTLSMVETAIEVTGGNVPTSVIKELIDAGRYLLSRPVELLDGVAEAVEALAHHHRLVVVTKGDLLHQESKMARSGLGEHFSDVEVVSEKDPVSYRRVLARVGVDASGFVMVGNSVRSDVLPVLEIGGAAVHIPYTFTWVHEQAEHDGNVPSLSSMAELPAWIAGRRK